VTGLLLNLFYVALLIAVSPVLAYRAWRHGKYRDGWAQKFLGRGAARVSNGPCLWLHAVSVGEVLLLRPLITELHRRRPDVEIWLSTTTHTGYAVAREKYPDCRLLYFPLDFTWSVRASLDRVRPDVIGLVELELWPNFVRAIAERKTPLVLVNGRIGERSFRGYRRIRFLMRRVLGGLTALGMQSPEYATRMIELGAAPERVTVTGSVKFDGVSLERDPVRLAALRGELGIAPAERVLLAGSTHAPEEQIILETYSRLRTEFPDLRLLIAPRHQERFEEVAALIRGAGWQVRRRSQSVADTGSNSTGAALSVILLDTLGELSDCWGLAEVAFVGGSLSTRGGQNMLEPCAVGAAVVVGPNTWNFKPAVELLTAAGGLATVRDVAELHGTLRDLLIDGDRATAMRNAAKQAIESQQGATACTVDLLLRDLERDANHPGSKRIAA